MNSTRQPSHVVPVGFDLVLGCRAFAVQSYASLALLLFASGLCLPSYASVPHRTAARFFDVSYHNPNSGRFWTMDSYEGAASDPASLHKYTYCNNNPVNSYDPGGSWTLTETIQTQKIGLSARLAFAGLLGTISGSISALDTAIGKNYSATPEELGVSFAIGFGAGFTLGFAGTYVPNAAAIFGAGLGGASIGSAIDDGNWAQVLFRSGTFGLGLAGPKSPTVRSLVSALFEFFNSTTILHGAKVPGGGLQAHENVMGGHTIAEHVGKTPTELQARLASTDPAKVSAASSFYNLETADNAVATALAANRPMITRWLAGTSARSAPIKFQMPSEIGISMARGVPDAVPVSGLRIILVRNPASPTGFTVLTSFPEP